MEEFVIVILGIVVLWLVAKVRGRSSEQSRIDVLGDTVARLQERLSRVEQALQRMSAQEVSPQQQTAQSAPAAQAALFERAHFRGDDDRHAGRPFGLLRPAENLVESYLRGPAAG